MKERNDYTINHIYIYNDIQENGERKKLEKECGQKLNADAALNYIPRTLFIFSFISRENFDMLQHLEKEIKKNSLAQFTLLAIHRERSESR